MDHRRREAVHGQRIVHEAVESFGEWRSGLAAAPAIRDLRDRAEAIRLRELARLEGSWDSLSEADRRRLEALTCAIVNKLLHEPTVRLRAAAREAEGHRHMESLRHLFGLDLPEVPPPPRPAEAPQRPAPAPVAAPEIRGTLVSPS